MQGGAALPAPNGADIPRKLMKLAISRETLLGPLTQVFGAIEAKQTLQVLSNVLIKAEADHIQLTGTDLEVELVASFAHPVDTPGMATLPARKLLDICKSLPANTEIRLTVDGNKATLIGGKSRFTLATLPVDDFPVLDEIEVSDHWQMTEKEFKQLLQGSAFAMANQDVRYYLNGILLETRKNLMRCVATDGHRLSLCDLPKDISTDDIRQAIIPRKGVQELLRLLSPSDESHIEVQLGSNHLRLHFPGLRFTCKLIDGRFPDYERVIPRNYDQIINIDKNDLIKALKRMLILYTDKNRVCGIRLVISENLLKLKTHGLEEDEGEEELEARYPGQGLEIGFNVNYFLDALNALDSETVDIFFRDPESSGLLKPPGNDHVAYVIMPIRL